MTTIAINPNASCTPTAIQDAKKNRFEQISLNKDLYSCLKESNTKLATAFKVTFILPAILWSLDKVMCAAEKIANAVIISPANFVHGLFYGRTVEALPEVSSETTSTTIEIQIVADTYSVVIEENTTCTNEDAIEAAPSSSEGKWIVGAVAVTAVSAGIYFGYATSLIETVQSYFTATPVTPPTTGPTALTGAT
jgi:hypothetical protein